MRRHPHFFACFYKIANGSLHVIQCRILKQAETRTCRPVGCRRLAIRKYLVITSAWLPALLLEVSLRCTRRIQWLPSHWPRPFIFIWRSSGTWHRVIAVKWIPTFRRDMRLYAGYNYPEDQYESVLPWKSQYFLPNFHNLDNLFFFYVLLTCNLVQS